MEQASYKTSSTWWKFDAFSDFCSRGLPNRRLFTELGSLEHGDTFILTVLGEIGYQVENIQVVLPDDTSVLTIEEEKD